MGEWVSKLWEVIKKVASTPAVVQASPGVATSYATTGQYMPRVKSTVGNEAGYLLDVVTAPTQPSDIKAAYQVARHPVQSARAAKKAVGEGVNYVKKKLAKKPTINLNSTGSADYTSHLESLNIGDMFKRLEFNTLMETGKLPDYAAETSSLSRSTRTVLPIPQETRGLLESTVYPRMALTRPNFTLDEFRELAYNKGFRLVPETEARIVLDRTKGSGNIRGFSSHSGQIAIREGNTTYALPHEVRHRIDWGRVLSNTEHNYLEKAYNNDFIKANSIVDGKPYNPVPDRVTTNMDARNRLFEMLDFNPVANPDLKVQNSVIDAASTDQIIEAVRNSNGYGRAYIKALENKAPTPADKMSAEEANKRLSEFDFSIFQRSDEWKKQIADAIKESMKYVGVGTGVATVVNKQKSGGKLISKRKKANSR